MDVDDGELVRMEAVIQSMTPKERRRPEQIDGSRRRRIAKGSGSDPQDVSGLVKSFVQMRTMLKQISGMGMMDRMRLGTQMAQASVLTGKMPKLTVKSHKQAAKEKMLRRKKRKRR
jgi:signal recognition particle subunit SRP54